MENTGFLSKEAPDNDLDIVIAMIPKRIGAERTFGEDP